MSTEREPDPIERMAIAHWTEHCSHLASDEEMAPYSWWQESMLAAVRELRNLLDLEGGNPSLLPGTDANQAYDASNVIERIILEHECRAGGKGE